MKKLIEYFYPDGEVLKLVFSSGNILIDKPDDDIYTFLPDDEYSFDAVACTAMTLTPDGRSDILDRVKTIPSREIKYYSERCIRENDAIVLPHNVPPLFLTPPQNTCSSSDGEVNDIMKEILRYEIFDLPYRAIRVTQYVKLYRKEDLGVWKDVKKAVKNYTAEKDQLQSPLELLYFDVDDECYKEVLKIFSGGDGQ